MFTGTVLIILMVAGLAIVSGSIFMAFKTGTALKPDLAKQRHETEAEILQEQKEQGKE